MCKIMVVDDEPDITYILKALFEKEGHEVLIANSGEECLDKLKTEKPDLIFLDVMMPGLSGFDVCRAIRGNENTRDITVVMLTVKSSDEDKIKSLEECANWHIPKPIDKKKLIEMTKWLLKCPPKRVSERVK